MATGPLVDRQTVAGHRLVELLDGARLDIRAALWLYRQDSDDWVLVLALPEAESQGPVSAYRRIARVYSANRKDLEPLKLDDLVVMAPSDPLLRLLSRAVQTGPSISEIRFSHNRIDGMLVEDALIYRLQAS